MSPFEPLIWLINGFLLILYLLLDHAAVVGTVPVLAWLTWSAAIEQRTWMMAGAAISVAAAALVPPPIPLIVLMMAFAGNAAVRLDRFNPNSMRWRVWGGLTLYSLAALGFTAYAAYTSRIDPHNWAGLLAQGEATAVVAQGRAFLATIAVWGLWVILPVGFLGMIVQGMLVHPPLVGSPSDLMYAIRSRDSVLPRSGDYGR